MEKDSARSDCTAIPLTTYAVMVKYEKINCGRCIYEYDAEHTIGGKGFLETDPPNFKGSFYSDTKGMVENVSESSSCFHMALVTLHSVRATLKFAP